ncbi:hypothetical protein CYJ46_11390 [Corynebacterium coyleae]|uniref:bifunctional glycosyltransferase/CDP-glycerol:glycerophosphate glycerophosphotransferase n=1 Tax=Corynebacterium coyleae TaxID=53374 RepID=UPI000C78C3B3|nr:CDP-glycerol glycerophosphotransferase family protein [Corynebacterium coyleae]PLA36904.1 hypothetical protein CYJ46_11390 [Corynebacterium coyleae]
MTVAVICYNNVETIEESIKSVVEQNFKELEILVIDDCSDDGSREVIERLLGEGHEFQFLSTDNNSGSASAPRNLAIDSARGDYITFLDGDDVLAPNACSNLYWNAVRHQVDIVTAQMVRRHVDSGRSSSWHGWLFRQSRTLRSADEEPDLVYDSTSTNKTYSTAFLRSHNLRFTEGVYFEDNEFSQRAFSLASGVRIIPDIVYYWEVYPEEQRLTITSDWQNIQSYSDRIRAFKEGYEAYGDRGMREIQRKLLNKTLKHDIWLFIDRAFNAQDLETMLSLWREAQPVIDLIDDSVLADLPLRQRAKIATLKEGDLQAFGEADLLTGSGQNMRGYIANGVWVPSNWNSERSNRPELLPFMAVADDPIGDLSNSGVVWRHQASNVAGNQGSVLIEGFTEDRIELFDKTRPVQVVGRLMMNGGDVIQALEGVSRGWRGARLEWSVRVEGTLEDSYLRNQQWRLELSLIQGEKVVQEEIQSPPGFKQVPFSPRTANIKGLTLDRLVVRSWKGRALYVRRLARPMPFGAPSRVLSTISRKLRAIADKVREKTSKDRILWFIGKVGRSLPVAKNVVLFESHMGKQFSDSPKAIYQEMANAFPDLKIFWGYSDRHVANLIPAHTVKRHSFRYAWILSRATCVVDNQGFPTYYTRRKGQLYIQTWHGVPLKRMGKDAPGKTQSELEEIKRSVSNWSVTFQPSVYYGRYLNEAMFYSGPVIEANLPRNDVLVTSSERKAEAVRRQLGLPEDKRLILWAPTFRESGANGVPRLGDLLRLEEFVSGLPQDAVLLVRAHYLNDISVPPEVQDRVINVGYIQEVADLYLAADMLITDYSSVMFDFALTGKPIVIFAPDFEDYRDSQRGLIFDIDSLAPGPFVTTQSQLLPAIEDVFNAPQKHAAEYSEFVESFCGGDLPSGAKAAVSYFKNWSKQ